MAVFIGLDGCNIFLCLYVLAQHLKLRSFGHDLHGLLSVIHHLSRMSLSSFRRLGTLGFSRKSSFVTVRW
jgi:hypothetical protein